jgi:hypothetical protein
VCSRDVAIESADHNAVVAGDVAERGTTMAQSVLERATEVVVARLATYYLSIGQIVRMLQRTHANLMKKQKEERIDQTATL